jgi:hypothetical protein
MAGQEPIIAIPGKKVKTLTIISIKEASLTKTSKELRRPQQQKQTKTNKINTLKSITIMG